MEYFARARARARRMARSWSEQYRLDLPAVCRGFLVKMSVFRVRTCAKVYELLYNISFRDNADISDIYIVASIPRARRSAFLHGTFDVVRSFLHIERASIRSNLYYKKKSTNTKIFRRSDSRVRYAQSERTLQIAETGSPD